MGNIRIIPSRPIVIQTKSLFVMLPCKAEGRRCRATAVAHLPPRLVAQLGYAVAVGVHRLAGAAQVVGGRYSDRRRNP